MKSKWRLLFSSGRLLNASAGIEPPAHRYWLYGLLTLLIFILGQHYLGPVKFRAFKDLFLIVFGLFCAVRNEDAARQAARPNKWLGRKDTSSEIPIYRWGYAVGGVCFVIFGVVDIFSCSDQECNLTRLTIVDDAGYDASNASRPN